VVIHQCAGEVGCRGETRGIPQQRVRAADQVALKMVRKTQFRSNRPNQRYTFAIQFRITGVS
jgi:hypothetical protein